MNQNDINRLFTEKVTELLTQGFQINPSTMGGSQGEYPPIIAPNFLLWTITGLLWTIAVNVHNRERFKEKRESFAEKVPRINRKKAEQGRSQSSQMTPHIRFLAP